jgi:hypothetical protein
MKIAWGCLHPGSYIVPLCRRVACSWSPWTMLKCCSKGEEDGLCRWGVIPGVLLRSVACGVMMSSTAFLPGSGQSFKDVIAVIIWSIWDIDYFVITLLSVCVKIWSWARIQWVLDFVLKIECDTERQTKWFNMFMEPFCLSFSKRPESLHILNAKKLLTISAIATHNPPPQEDNHPYINIYFPLVLFFLLCFCCRSKLTLWQHIVKIVSIKAIIEYITCLVPRHI